MINFSILVSSMKYIIFFVLKEKNKLMLLQFFLKIIMYNYKLDIKSNNEDLR